MAGKFWYVDSSGKRKRTKAGLRREYDKYQSSEDAKKDRAKRNSARRSAMKSGRVHKGDNKDIDHVKGLSEGGSNSPSNLRVTSRRINRGRRQASRKRGSRRNTRDWGI